MAAPGVTGIAAALFVYGLLTNIFSYADTGQIVDDCYFNANTKIPSVTDLLSKHINKHFGYGRYALAAILIQSHLPTRVKKCTTTKLKTQQSYALVTMFLLLSGDIHQCPGPLSDQEQGGHYTTSTHSGSVTGSIQVHSLHNSHYTNMQQTDLSGFVSPSSVVGIPVPDADVNAGWKPWRGDGVSTCVQRRLLPPTRGTSASASTSTWSRDPSALSAQEALYRQKPSSLSNLAGDSAPNRTSTEYKANQNNSSVKTRKKNSQK